MLYAHLVIRRKPLWYIVNLGKCLQTIQLPTSAIFSHTNFCDHSRRRYGLASDCGTKSEVCSLQASSHQHRPALSVRRNCIWASTRYFLAFHGGSRIDRLFTAFDVIHHAPSHQ